MTYFLIGSITLLYLFFDYLNSREKKKPINTKAKDIESLAWMEDEIIHDQKKFDDLFNQLNTDESNCSNNLPFAGGEVCKRYTFADGVLRKVTKEREQTDEEMLQQCLEEENFELAAVIRDRMKSKGNV